MNVLLKYALSVPLLCFCLSTPVSSFVEIDDPSLPAKRVELDRLSLAPGYSPVNGVLSYIHKDHRRPVSTIDQDTGLKLEPVKKPSRSVYRINQVDQPVVDALKAHFTVNNRIKKRFGRNSLAHFYQSRSFAPLWHKKGRLTGQAVQLVQHLSQAEFDGLAPEDYAYPWHLGYLDLSHEQAVLALVRQELTLSRLAARYFQDAHRGRLDPSVLPGEVGFRQKNVSDGAVLATLAIYDDPSRILALANPQTDLFTTVKRHLGMILEAERIAEQPVPDVPVREAFFYEPVKAVNKAVKAFVTTPAPSQPVIHENQTLLVDRRTSEVPNFDIEPMIVIPRDGMVRYLQHRKADLIATMELARWLPDNLGDTYVFVNIPEFSVRVIEDSELIYDDRVVVGKPRFKTPIFADNIESIVVNPYWNVPKSIMLNEMLPKLRANESLGRGYEVVSPVGRVYHTVSSRLSRQDIAKGYRIRQRPGPDNALGTIKFLFPNKFSVYMHDTPAKKLFNRDVRAFSHGCVRLNDPWAFAEVISDLQDDITINDLTYVRDYEEETSFNLDRNIPVIITYFPLHLDDDGILREKDDVYGYLGLIRKKLRLE